MPDVKAVIAVGSGKGGVGKSTVATNLALSLHQKGYKVGLLDADIYGPSIPMMMGVSGLQPQVNSDGRIEAISAHGIKTMSIGFIAKDTQAIIWRGPMIHKMLDEFLSRVSWGALDYLIVDLPPGTGDAQLSLSQLIPLTGAVIVTTPQEVALADVKRAVQMFLKVKVPLLGVVENMSYYECTKCHDRAELFSSGGGEEAARLWETRFLGSIPIVIDIRIGGDKGVPIVVSDPELPVSRAMGDMATNLISVTEALSSQRASEAEALQVLKT